MDAVTDHTELFTIGELARRTGLPVRTIRFWSDSGLVAPAGRSAGGYRLYDAGAVARLDLVRSLRELGLDLATVRRVLERRATVRDVAAAHLHALEAEIRVLQVRRAVLRWVVRSGGTTKEMRLMHKLAQMSARERQRVIDDFVSEVFEGVGPDAPGARIAESMRTLPASLPEDPAPEQVEAWAELAELVGDAQFRRRVREMALAGARGGREEADPGALDAASSRSTPGGRCARASPRSRRPARRSWRAWWTRTCPRRTGTGWPISWRCSPTGGWSGTGSCWGCSTAGRRRRRRSRRSSG